MASVTFLSLISVTFPAEDVKFPTSVTFEISSIFGISDFFKTETSGGISSV